MTWGRDSEGLETDAKTLTLSNALICGLFVCLNEVCM
jgi:hypothetical protein